MALLRFLHVLFVMAWLGSASGEIVLELLLWFTPSVSRQRAYIDLHRVIDLVVEGPALILALVTGTLLMWKEGYFGADARPWPAWLEDKLMAVAFVAVANLICVVFVLLRAREADQVMGSTPPLSKPRVRRWHQAIAATMIGAPFALIALWLAVNKGQG